MCVFYIYVIFVTYWKKRQNCKTVIFVYIWIIWCFYEIWCFFEVYIIVVLVFIRYQSLYSPKFFLFILVSFCYSPWYYLHWPVIPSWFPLVRFSIESVIWYIAASGLVSWVKMVLGVPVESGIHWEFHHMLSDGDAHSWWLLLDAEWFKKIFLTASGELTWLRRRRVNLKLDGGCESQRLRASPSISIGDMKSKDFLMYRCALKMSMTKGDMSDCYQKFGMVLKK